MQLYLERNRQGSVGRQHEVWIRSTAPTTWTTIRKWFPNAQMAVSVPMFHAPVVGKHGRPGNRNTRTTFSRDFSNFPMKIDENFAGGLQVQTKAFVFVFARVRVRVGDKSISFFQFERLRAKVLTYTTSLSFLSQMSTHRKVTWKASSLGLGSNISRELGSNVIGCFSDLKGTLISNAPNARALAG